MLLTIYVIAQKTMSPRKSEEDFMNKFCKSQEGVCEGANLIKTLQSCHFNILGINHRCLTLIRLDFLKVVISKGRSIWPPPPFIFQEELI